MDDEHCGGLCATRPGAWEVCHALLANERALRRAADRAAAAQWTFLLASRIRIWLTFALRESGGLCVCDLGWITACSPEYITYHLRVLLSHELVRSHREGKHVVYELTDQGETLLEAVLGEEADAKR